MDTSLREDTGSWSTRLYRDNLGLKVWNILTGLSLFLPLFAFTVARIANQEEGDNNRDQANESYREWRECNDDGGDNWYKYWCNKAAGYYDENGDWQDNEQQDENEIYAPWWWRFKADQEEEEDSSAVFAVLYFWTLLLVVGLVFVVNRNYGQGKLKTTRWFLIGWVIYAVTIAVLLGGIPELIMEEGQELAEIGWYGQTSVLSFITVTLELITCAIFSFWIGKLIKSQRTDLKEFQKEDTEAGYTVMAM